MTFKITKPGVYVTRGGYLAEVVYRRGRRWYGHQFLDTSRRMPSVIANSWDESGYISGPDNELRSDLVAEEGFNLFAMAGGEFAEPLMDVSS